MFFLQTEQYINSLKYTININKYKQNLALNNCFKRLNHEQCINVMLGKTLK